MIKNLLPYLVLLPAAIYSLLTLYCAGSFFRRQTPGTGYLPSVTIIKPVKGLDRNARENFASFFCQDYPVFQLIFALASANDPALPLIRGLQAAYPHVDMAIVVDDAIYGPNRKVCNIINAWPLVKHAIVFIADSDIRVGPEYLQRTVAHFADPGVGLVTNLYRASGVEGIPAAIEALGFTAEMIPNVLVALRLEGLSFALGASIACRREALEAAGGFLPLADFLADDYQLGNRISRSGWRLELSGEFVESVSQSETLVQILSRQLRWCRTIRVSRPLGYLASGLTQPFWGVLSLLVFSGFTPAAGGAIFALYSLRGVVAMVFSRAWVKDNLLPFYFWLLPLRDALYSLTWAISLFGYRVQWRGRRYRLQPGGKIVPAG